MEIGANSDFTWKSDKYFHKLRQEREKRKKKLIYSWELYSVIISKILTVEWTSHQFRLILIDLVLWINRELQICIYSLITVTLLIYWFWLRKTDCRWKNSLKSIFTYVRPCDVFCIEKKNPRIYWKWMREKKIIHN